MKSGKKIVLTSAAKTKAKTSQFKPFHLKYAYLFLILITVLVYFRVLQFLPVDSPLQYFSGYLRSGYYPFFKEEIDLYHNRIEEVVNMILEVELPLLRGVDISYINKLKQLLLVVSESAPFVPNISKLSQRIGINRQTMLSYLYYLNEAHLLNSVYKEAHGISLLQKPDKIFLENTNLMYTFKGEQTDMGNARETFFVNQVRYKYELTISEQSDFWVAGKYNFEIGGKNKNKRQIKQLTNAFIAADDIEYGFENKIPLWLFGFLY